MSGDVMTDTIEIAVYCVFLALYSWHHFQRSSKVIICPVAISQHGTAYTIAGVYVCVCVCVCVCVSVSVCHRSCGRNFKTNLIKLCTVVWGRKTKTDRVH